MANKSGGRVAKPHREKLDRSSSRHLNARRETHEDADFVPKRLRVMYFDARRAEVFQSMFSRECPTMEYAYGELVKKALDILEQQRGMEFLVGQKRPEV